MARTSRSARSLRALSLRESWASYDRASRSWRTSQITWLSDLETCSEIWPTSGTMRNGECFSRQTPDHLKDDPDYSPLPTLGASESKDFSRACVLAELGMRGYRDRVARILCANSPMLRSSPEIVGLHPSFAAWMMGFPLTWQNDVSAPSVTRSSHKSQKSSAAASSKSQEPRE